MKFDLIVINVTFLSNCR